MLLQDRLDSILMYWLIFIVVVYLVLFLQARLYICPCQSCQYCRRCACLKILVCAACCYHFFCNCEAVDIFMGHCSAAFSQVL